MYFVTVIEGLQLKLKEYKLHLRSMQQSKSSGASTPENAGDMVLFSQVPHEYFPLVWPSLVGFSLTNKSWGDVLLDGVRDIQFDPDIFDRLFLPDSRKRMIKALIKHTNVEGGFHDLIAGKGEGTVFLLYGEPGNGKTLTAEAVAETLHRPLYSVSMGTLGTTADELEKRLSEILLLSSKWNALVLLDEADSFLEARSPHSSLERNAMVSVMLRLVEYHQGILFLTSNRIESLDPAFQTRITLALRYDSLDLDGRAAVWTNLLEKSGFGSALDTIDVRALAVPVLNGRDIKNALRLAMALAADQGESLTQELLVETAMTVNGYRESMRGDWKMEEHAVRRKRRGWIRSLWHLHR
jgi:SpoVK/Ycf46/Vps4 family AAA+-type ATPase